MKTPLLTFTPLNSLPLRTSRKLSQTTVQARIGEPTLGVDYGLRRIGLAVSVGISPRPLLRIEHLQNPKLAADAVAHAANGSVAQTIVVGMPLTSSGDEGEQAAETRLFLNQLALSAPWANIMWLDERFTTADAKQVLSRAGVKQQDVPLYVDSASAVVLLERYFSDNDDSLPVVFHAPDASAPSERVEKKQVERMTYAQWKADAVARARSLNSENL